MEHGFTWYNLLPHELQAVLPEHTFFAIIVSLLVIVFALCARTALAASTGSDSTGGKTRRAQHYRIVARIRNRAPKRRHHRHSRTQVRALLCELFLFHPF